MSENNDFHEDDIVSGTSEPSSAPPQKTAAREAGEWVLSIVVALLIAILLRNYVISFVKVDGSSMVPTLTNGERLIVIRCGYKPHAGDIIILNPPSGRGPYVKRVIALPGQTIKFDNETGSVFIDGEKLDEPYINNKTTSRETEYKVPENSVFVMGDNRGSSHDSRAQDVSFIPYKNVLGKVVFRVWPFTKFGRVN